MSRNGLFLATSAAALLLSAGAATAAPALPTGGAVAAGSAAISNSGSSLTISQSTPKAIIDWSSFSIGQGGSVQFNNGSGATLNRVTGTAGSSIDGLLSGTGSVYLINPNGVIVGKSGVVNVGGTFVASTLDVPDASFLSGGNLTFSGGSTAAVVNEGKVGSLGGDVVLIAANVSNSGSLSAANGTVGLLAGQSVLLRDQALDGGEFSVLVGGSGTSATNSGLIEAANAELRANGGNIYALAGNTAGVIRASGVDQGSGHVWLVADSGSLDVAGTITARGPSGSGGTIETSGADVKIGASSIDAGVGGTWLVDPYDLTIDAAAASSINGALGAGTNVVEQTTAGGASGFGNPNASGNGDIFVQAPISWSTGAQLTLDAYRNISITAPITASGAGKVVLNTGSGGGGGVLGFGLGFTGFTGPLSFTGAEGGGQSLTINGTPYTLIYTMAELAALNGTSGNDALAVNLSPSSTYTDAVVKTFSGNFEGLGHVVQNLNINAPTTVVGLFGTLNAPGSISDVGIVGGTVTGQSTVGDLVGSSTGAITHSYATGAVNGTEGGNLGGLVGYAGDSAITWSYATGAVTGTPDAPHLFSYLGGLLGYGYNVTLDHDYATGAVTGPYYRQKDPQTSNSQYVGGLVGYLSGGSITISFATGNTTGYSGVAPLAGAATGIIDNTYASGDVVSGNNTSVFVGLFTRGNITHSLALSGNQFTSSDVGPNTYDYVMGVGSNGAQGIFPQYLKQNLPPGLSSAVWGLVPGVSYPYLKDFWTSPPEVITGRVNYSSQVSGKKNLGQPAPTYFAAINGSTAIGSSGVLADGGFYFLAPAGTLAAGSTVLLYSPTLPTAAAYERIAGGSMTGLTLTQQYASIISPDTTLSATVADLAAGLGPATSGAPFTMSGGLLTVAPQTLLQLAPTGSSFDFNQNLVLGTDVLVLNAAGSVTQSVGRIATRQLTGSSVGGLTLSSVANRIDQLHGWNDPTGVVSITDGERLPVAAAPIVAAGVNLTTTHGDIAINNPIRSPSGTVNLNSAGKVTETADGLIASNVLNATAVGGIGLDSQNTAASISLQNSGGGSVQYANKGALTVATVSNTGSGAISLVTTLSSGGAAAMSITGPVNGGNVTLTSRGAISETGSGAITASLLTGSASGAVSLNGANQIAVLSDFTDYGGGSGDFSLTDGQALKLTGTFEGSGHTLSLTTTSGGITLTGVVDVTTANLISASTIKETASAHFSAPTFQGSANGAVTLNGPNAISNITGFTDTGGDFILNDGEALTLTGTFDGTGHAITLTSTSGAMAVNGTVKAATLSLSSITANLTESNSTGAIIAGTINAAANTGITLASPNNHITTIGTDHTNSGPNHIQQ